MSVFRLLRHTLTLLLGLALLPGVAHAKPPVVLDEAAAILDADYFLNLIGRLSSVRSQKSLVYEADENKRLLRGLYLTNGLRFFGQQDLTHFQQMAAGQKGRDEIWYRLGDRYWRQGDLKRAEQSWLQVKGKLTPEWSDRRNFLLANQALSRKEFKQAKGYVGAIRAGSELHPLALFNRGFSLLNGGQVKGGLQVLKALSGDTKQARVSERANLALARHHIAQGQPSQAQAYLEQMAISGPQSDPALLLLGWLHFDQGDYRASLGPWEELKTHDINKPVIWPALLGIPLAKQKLGGEQAALLDYYFALESYRNRIRFIDKALKAVRSGGFLNGLKDKKITDGLPEQASWILPDIYPPNRPELVFLKDAFVSHRFNEAVRAYRSLRFLTEVLGIWKQESGSYRTILKYSLKAYQENLPSQLKFLQTSHQRGISRSSYEWVFNQKTGQDLRDGVFGYRLRQLVGDAQGDSARQGRLVAGLGRWYGATQGEAIEAYTAKRPKAQRTPAASELAQIEAEFFQQAVPLAGEKRKRLQKDSRSLAKQIKEQHEEMEDLVLDQEVWLTELAAADLLQQRKQLERLLMKAAQAIDRIHYQVFTRGELES